MKKQFLLAFGLASMLLAGCSDSDNVADGGNTPDPNAKSYLSLRLNLPTSTGSGSRADENFKNDQFDTDRLVSDEYKVNDITLVCFNSSNVIVGKVGVTAGSYSWANGTEDGITTQAVLPIQEVDKDTKKVLVLVNKPAGIAITNGKTFDAFNAEITASVDDLTGTSRDNFFMTNSPLSNGNNGSTSYTTVLVDVTPQTTKEAAMAYQRDIYVERAVGKVSVSVGIDWGADWSYTITADEGFKDDKITIKAWAIDNYNTKTFPVRKYVENASTWEAFTTKPERFVGSLIYHGNQYFSVAPSTPELSRQKEGRTYWCIDPNYDSNSGLTTSTTNLTDAADVAAMEKPQYCLENTFNVKNMSLKNTTRVIIKALYTPKGFEANKTWFRLGNSGKAYSLASLEEKINQELGLSDANIVKLKTDYTFAQGKQDFAEAMFQAATPGTNAAITTDQVTKLNKQLSKLIAFIDGYCYYTTLVKHFGSEFTPWGGDSSAPEVDGTKFHNYVTSYKGADDETRYLGRYGIVRNNWYQLVLNKVTAPGAASVPDVETDNTSDDEQKYYIQATVKIMDWAVRKQSVDL